MDAGAVYVGLTSLALILLVIGAGVRANTIAGDAVPALGVSTLVGALGAARSPARRLDLVAYVA